MPTPSEIQKKARRINTVSDSFCRSKDRCQGYVYNSSSWWMGEAGQVLRSEYSDIEVDINRILRKMGELENCISNLSGRVRQADDERRRRVEELKRLALAANKK